jgi:NAD(P)-dependent dehydrogenase (short-subunit alcohol dehydrogenase family)
VAAEIGATPIQLDATDADSIAAAVDRLRDEAGLLDILVNNAGIAGEQRRPGEATIDDLRLVFETNVIGAAAVIDAVTPLLEASAAPVVVNVSSAVGSLTLNMSPDSRWTMLAYPMSKAALNMLTVQYAKAYPRWRVNAVTPGRTATEFAAVQGGWSVAEGAEIIVQMATVGLDGPTGTFVERAGVVPW